MTEGLEVAVDAAYHQYYVGDRTEIFDAEAAALVGDGILGPAGTAVKVSSGATMGPVMVLMRVTPSPVRPTGVAAACDVWLPSGVFTLMTYDSMPVRNHDFGGPQRCRVMVEVSGRDRRDLEGGPPEHHVVTVSPAETSTPRWRSVEIDAVGRALELVTDHVGPYPAG